MNDQAITSSLPQSLQASDIALLRLVHHNRVVALDGGLYVFSFVTTYVSITLLLTVLVRFFRQRQQCQQSQLKQQRQLRRQFFTLLAVLLTAATLSFSIKQLVRRERPFAQYADIQKLSEGGSPSFPSGHTLEAFAMATGFVLVFARRRTRNESHKESHSARHKLWRWLFVWAALVGYSRMALGVHYPLDVAGGAVLGVMTAWLVVAVAARLGSKHA
jgi:membrane-associated phospholipid phosphatase